ncbi:Proteasome activator subunit 4 [Vitis vinifera]|uniref:Proteasome activator subunit 4 n=1 Tax=Vitis vinifera TaxID=29760 RepID=A0A438K068_VITVI|nr:Proteasome activator subunit 4 [Vitis vinifera]
MLNKTEGTGGGIDQCHEHGITAMMMATRIGSCGKWKWIISFFCGCSRNTRFLFSNKAVTPAKAMRNQLYYHPSNGVAGHIPWSGFYSIWDIDNNRQAELYLGRSERMSFVNVVLKLIDRGQYSKNEHLSETVAAATSILSYVEPSLVLPFLASRFHLALETMTATHQLKTAVTSVAFAGRSLFLTSLSTSAKSDDLAGADVFIDLLSISLSNALLGMDANDPPKTLATMQLIGSIFSNMATLEDNTEECSFMPSICFSEWLDEFLCRLFSLLLHLEPSSVLNEGLHSSATSGTFLVEDGPYYFCMLEILLGRLSKSLYNQALKKISKFVRTNILPGAIAEVGLLCCACVHSNPEEAVVSLIEPILSSVISSLKGTPVTGFGGSGISDPSVSAKAKPTISPALETAIDYQLKNTISCHQLWRLMELVIMSFVPFLEAWFFYYPIDQYKCILHHPDAAGLEEWISTKDYVNDEPLIGPKWHVPSKEEVHFANELLNLHFQSALDDLLRVCQTKMHSDPGVLSCLPDFRPSRNGMVEDQGHISFLIAGSTGSSVGSTELREKAAEIIHTACKQAWKLESAAIIEPPINFIVSSHSKGKRRPRWALTDKAYMHSTWRSSQSSYHLYRTSGNISPSDHAILLMDDLLNLSLHRYETVRGLAGKALLKMIKRWPSMISKCVLTLTENIRNPNSPEYAVLGSCAVLATQTVLKHLTMDPKAFSSFLLDSFKVTLFSDISQYLNCSHHESLKAQKAINELFVKYNIHFAEYLEAFSKHWTIIQMGLILRIWYNLMANRVLLLLAMASRNDPHFSPSILSETAGHFLKNLKSQLPQTRILAISALNTLLKESPYKLSAEEKAKESPKSSLEGALSQIFQEEGFFNETLNSLSHVHIISDTESASSRGNHGNSSFQSLADKSISRFYFDFSASWPRTPSWISLLGSDTFYSSFARIFKRLTQECGMSVLLALKSTLEEFANAKESWMMVQLQNIILAPTVESIPEWAACIRYAVTGKEIAKRYAFLSAALIEVSPQKMPVTEIQLHNKLLKELLANMSHSSAQVREAIGVTLSVLCSNIRLYRSFAHNYSHEGLDSDVVNQVKGESWVQFLTEQALELVMNIQKTSQSDNLEIPTDSIPENGLSNGNSQDDIKWMETLFHFIISSLKSGRSSYLLDVIVGLLYPVISLQETSNKDLSTLAKAAFELLKWRIFWEPHLQKAVSVILSSANDFNWRTRSATLTYLRTFMYRYAIPA